MSAVLDAVDPRLAPALREELARPGAALAPAATQTLAIAGHRAAGKTRLLPLLSALTGRPGVDLDAELARQHGRALRDWVREDVAGFRAAERAAFAQLPPGSLVALGGGFLSHHPDALAGTFTVLVPLSAETYRERLLADRERPRLRPELSLEEEISRVWAEREALHARVPTVPLVHLLRALLPPRSA
ncbi:shikimate kinase [Aggregicoccus sp. 17bor-14]|uniref:shikimate kinase n=1 Tax=Myxococcaceae TaxID=31 RepID=UPI003519E2F5